MTTPGWYALAVLALGVYRVWRLVARDELTSGLRRRVLGVSDAAWSQWEYVVKHVTDLGDDPWEDDPPWDGEDAVAWLGDELRVATGNERVPPIVEGDVLAREEATPPVGRWRWKANQLARCPWCLGAWLSLAAWLAWQTWPGATLALASLAAISAIVGLVTARLDPA